jgi:carbonic anhydrase
MAQMLMSAQFMECMHVQSAVGASNVVNKTFLTAFMDSHDLSPLSVSDAYDTATLRNLSKVYQVSSTDMVPNGPCVLSKFSSGDVMSVTPAYALHEVHSRLPCPAQSRAPPKQEPNLP